MGELQKMLYEDEREKDVEDNRVSAVLEGRLKHHACPPDLWCYKPGTQLLCIIDRQWLEASVIEMRPDGRYSVWVNTEHSASESIESFVVATGSPKKSDVLLTKDDHRISARFSYEPGMEICVYQSSRWRDAIVQDDAIINGFHRLQLAGRDSEEISIILNPFNHGIRFLNERDYITALLKYRSFIRTRCGTIEDALTGQRLDIEDQCANLQLVASTGQTMDSSGENVTQPITSRTQGREDSIAFRVLITAEAASGKTVKLRQFVYDCCKWNCRDLNDTVPILILIIDLQRSIENHVDDYNGRKDLAIVFLRLKYEKTDPMHFRFLMQVVLQTLLPFSCHITMACCPCWSGILFAARATVLGWSG